MDFKVNRDNKVWVITACTFAVLAGAVALTFIYTDAVTRWIVTLIAVAIVTAGAVISPVKLRITSTGIELFKLIGKKRFPYCDMKNIALCDLQTAPNIRIFGTGGFMSYTGWFYNKQIGRFYAYIGSMYRTVLITMNNGNRYVVSCLNPDKLVEISRTNLRTTKNRLQK